jgi:hypothetical protein
VGAHGRAGRGLNPRLQRQGSWGHTIAHGIFDPLANEGWVTVGIDRDTSQFSYRPRACNKDYRVVALRKNLSIERGEDVLFCEYRYFFSAPRGALTYLGRDWR